MHCPRICRPSRGVGIPELGQEKIAAGVVEAAGIIIRSAVVATLSAFAGHDMELAKIPAFAAPMSHAASTSR